MGTPAFTSLLFSDMMMECMVAGEMCEKARGLIPRLQRIDRVKVLHRIPYEVFHDLFGLNPDFTPRHAKRYTECGKEIQDAVGRYAEEVLSGTFVSR